MPICEKCGNIVSVQTKFCVKCGTKVGQEESTSNSVTVDLPNHINTKHIPAKKNSFLKYLLLLAVAVASTFYFIVNGKNSYDSLGYKHGNWIEYINGDGSQEVSKKSAKFIRHIKYSHGYSLALVKDYYPNGNIQCEFALASEPYSKNGERPKDKLKGLVKWFDENTKIKSWMYYDSEGKLDTEKYILQGLEDIKQDTRFDETVYNEKYSEERELIIKMEKITQDNEELLRQIENYQPNENSNDELPPMSSDNEIENTTGNYNKQSSGNSTQRLNQRCNNCYGTGKCPECKGPFTVHYWDSRSNRWNDRNETRPGYKICTTCRGAGIIYTGGWDYNVNPKQPLSKPCYVGGCMNGWEFCQECNNSGNGNDLGVCKKCKGTGISK